MAKDYVIELPGGKSKRYTEDEFSSPNVQNFLQSDQQYKVYELQPLAPVENEDTKDDIFTLTLPNGNSKTYSNEDYHTPNVQRFVEDNKDVKVERMRPYDYWGERAKTQQAELDEFDRTNGDFIAEYEARQSELDDDSLPEERRKKANEYVAENKRYYDELVNQLQTKQEAYENNPAVISKRNDYRNQTVEDLKKQKAANEAKWNKLAKQDIAAQNNPNDKSARRRLFLNRLALAGNPAALVSSEQPGTMNVTSHLTGNAEDEANYKAANQLIDESIKLYGATKKKDFQGMPWYEKTAKAVASMAEGGADRATEQEFWEELVDPVTSNHAIYKLHNKVTGLIGSYNDIQEDDMAKVLDDNLTDSEQALLEAYLRNSQATNDNKDIHWSYKSGGSFADSMKFMAEMMVGSGATGSAANGATKGMLKWFAKRAGTASTKLGRAAIKGTGKFAVGETRALVGGAIQTAVGPSTYAGVMERIATINDKGELDRTVEGALDGIFDRYIENASEFGLGLANKGLQAGKRQLAKAIGRRQWGSLYSGSVGRVMKAAGIQSGVEEWGEELNGAYIRALAGLMTGNKIGNTKEMGEFWSGENQLILLTSFAPTIGGGAALSVAQRKHLHNQQQSKKESLYNYLINTSGYTEDAAKAFVDAVGGDTPYDLAHNTSPYLRQFLKDNESDATGYKMILDYINTTAKALEADSRNAIDQKVNREHEREAVTGSMQGHSGFTMKRELPNGSAYMNGVRRVQIDGKTGYIVSGDETEWGVNYEDGSVGYLSEKDIQDAVSNGNGADTGWMTEEDFLDLHAVENKKAAEEMRMGSEKAKQAEDLKSVLTPQAEIPWDQGTAIVNQILPDGYVIQTPDGQINQYSISQIAEHMGNPIDSKSDEELENDEVVNIEHREELKDKVDVIAKRGDAVPLERDGKKYHINAALGWEEKEDGTPVLHVYVTDEEGNNDSMMLETEEVAAYLGVNEAAWAAKGGDTMTMEQNKPKPASYTDDKGVLRDKNGKAIPIVMDEKGQPIFDEDGNPTVNEDAFIQESPEAWAAWNDEQRQDGGSSSIALIGKLHAKAEAALVEAQKAIAAETSPSKLKVLEKQAQEIKDLDARYDAILNSYMAPEQKKNEAVLQRASEWEKATGVKVIMLERPEDVANTAARKKIEAQMEAEKQGKPAEKVKGWYDTKTKEVYFYLPNIDDAKDLDETFIHEVVSHRGLRELLGARNYAVLCRRVWDELMTEEQREEYIGYVSHLKGSEEDRRLAAADEFIAYFAEQMRMSPTEEVRTTWQQFVKMLLDLLNRITGTTITEEDLSSLLADSLTRYKLLNRQQTRESKREEKQEPKQESALSKIPSFTDNDGETDYKWSEAPDIQTALLGMSEAGLDSDSIKEFAANRVDALAGEAKKIAADKRKAASPKQMQKLNDALKENGRETLFWQTILDTINLAEAAEEQGAKAETKTETSAAEKAKQEPAPKKEPKKKGKRLSKNAPTEYQTLHKAVEDIIDEMDFATQVRYAVSRYKFLWDDLSGSKGLAHSVIATKGGASRHDKNQYFAWIAGKDKGGKTPEQIAEAIMADMPEAMTEGHDTSDALDIVLDAVTSAKSPSALVRQVYADIVERQEKAELEEAERQADAMAKEKGFANFQDYVTFEELQETGEDLVLIPESEIENYYNAIYGTEADERTGEGQGVLEGSSGGVLGEASGEETTQRQNEGNIPGGNGQNEVYGRGNSLGQGEASDNGSLGIRAGGSETRSDNVPVRTGTSGTAQNGVIQGLDGYTEQEIKEIVGEYMEDTLGESMPDDFRVTDIRIIGSRSSGTAREDSDLDILVEYEGSVREDDLFNALNGEDGLEIDGIKVDINPITPGKSGTIQEFLERNKDYKKEEPQPIGRGFFGNIYDQFKGKVKEAFDFLVSHKSGDLLGVFHDNELGDIDLVWGSKESNAGLEHIIDKHVGKGRDFETVEDAQKAIQEIIANGKKIKDNLDKIIYELNGKRVVAAKYVRNAKGEIINENKNWVVTSYDNNTPKSQKKQSASTLVTPESDKGSRAVAPDVSESKDTQSSESPNENGENNELTDAQVKALAFVTGKSEEEIRAQQGGLPYDASGEKTLHHPATLRAAYESGNAADIAKAEKAVGDYIMSSDSIEKLDITAKEFATRKKQAEKGSAEYRMDDFCEKKCRERIKEIKREAAEVKEPTERIDDVGEKIGGARKDLAQKMSDKIDLDADNFPKMFPKFDLKKMVEQGLDPKLAVPVQFLRQAAYEEYKRYTKRYGKKYALKAAQFYAAYAKRLLETGNADVDFKDSGFAFTEYGQAYIKNNIALFEKIYETLGDDMFGLDLKDYYIIPLTAGSRANSKYYRRGENGEMEQVDAYYATSHVGGGTSYYEEGRLGDAIDEVVGRLTESVDYKKSHPYKLVHYYRPGVKNSDYVGVKLGGKVVPLTDTMSSAEVQRYMRDHEAELQEKARMLDEQRKQKGEKSGGEGRWKPELTLGGKRTRVGKDFRGGRNVSPEEFRSTFGFRGVEFGNYVTQQERQRFLNESYDALMDLADMLGVSPRALGLGGQLGFAIGARGGGGQAAAHYEPGKNVINLTKTQGAGSLAHEWWHALDYFLNRDSEGRRKKSATANRRQEDFNTEAASTETINAFLRLMRAIEDSEYMERSKQLEEKVHPNRIGEGYYDKPTELAARAFQDYVQRRLTNSGQINDFLSSFTPDEKWNGEPDTYPYPQGEEATRLGSVFDSMFATMQEREEDGNVVLFRMAGEQAEQARLDKEYVEAVKSGDIDKALDMLREKALTTEGITGYVAPNAYSGSHRDVAKLIKTGKSDAVQKAAADMARFVPNNAVLVPIPSHEGKVTDETDTKILADAVAEITGSPVVVALEGNPRESRYQAKQQGKEGLKADELGFRQIAEIPEGKIPVFIDNVVDSGETAKAASEAIKGGFTMAYAKGVRSNPTSDLKNMTVTYDDNGNLIPLSQRFDADNTDVRFREANANQAIFVSNAQKAVENIKQEKATPEQWLAMIRSKGGLKAGEDKWMGLSQWLNDKKAEGVKTLTKPEVLDFIDSNKIEIEEERYAEEGAFRNTARFKEFNDEYRNLVADSEEKWEEADRDYAEFMDDMRGKYGEDWDSAMTDSESHVEEQLLEAREMWQENPAEAAFNYMVEEYGDDFGTAFMYDEDGLDIADPDAAAYYLEGDGIINDVRLGYTTEGLENKREIALTVPTIEPWDESDKTHFGDAGGGTAIGWIRFGETWTREDAGITHPVTGKEVSAKRDAKTLVIDEIQSKRHQEGREKGYRNPISAEQKDLYNELKSNHYEAINRLSAFVALLNSKYGSEAKFVKPEDLFEPGNKGHERWLASFSKEDRSRYNTLDEEVRKASVAVNNMEEELGGGDFDTRVPDAPFDKNWPELCMKRMLRLAAEEGYGKMAWTSGEIQADRYDLGRQVRSIFAGFDQDGNRGLLIHLLDGPTIDIIHDDKGNIIKHNSVIDGLDAAKNISDLVGKEIAADALTITGKGTANGREYKDDALRVGISGMQGFYDKMLPAFMTKYGKQWGVKPELQEFPDIHGKWWTIDITPEMKADVMEGQVMFRIGNNERTHELNDKQKNPGEDHIIAEPDVFERKTLDEAYQDAYMRGDTELAESMVRDAFKAAYPNTKVVDKKGEPLVVEHATNDDFTEFDIDYLGKSSKDKGLFGAGFYFGTHAPRWLGETKNIMKVFLGMNKPFEIDDSVKEENKTIYHYLVDKFDIPALRALVLTQYKKSINLGEYIDIIKAVDAEIERGEHDEKLAADEEIQNSYRPQDKMPVYRYQLISKRAGDFGSLPNSIQYIIAEAIGSEEFSAALKEGGYDGVIADRSENYKEYVAFYPSQIKSAETFTFDDQGNLIPLSQRFNEQDDDIRFRLSKNNRKTVESWLNKRTDIDAAERESTLAYIDNLADAKTQLATGWWFAKGTIRLPEDMPKVEQAVAVSTIAKVDPLKYSSPMELINAHADIQVKEKPINPDEVSTLHKHRELPDGIVIYDVDDSEESRKNMRAIIDTHFGKESSPWCLLQGDGEGNLTSQSREYWDYYNSYPKQVAFKDGKLLAFSANRGDRLWWDKQDRSYYGIPVTGKIPGDEQGRMADMEYNSETGKLMSVGRPYIGNRNNGEFMEWFDVEGPLIERSHFKDGRRVGKFETWYPDGTRKEFFQYDEDGRLHGPMERWYENGQQQTKGQFYHSMITGEYKEWYPNGQLAHKSIHGEPDEYNFIHRIAPEEEWHPNGTKKKYMPFDKDGKINGRVEFWNASGDLIDSVEYKDGRKDGEEIFYQHGQPVKLTYWRNGSWVGEKYLALTKEEDGIRFRETPSLFSPEEMVGNVAGSQRSINFAGKNRSNAGAATDIQRQGDTGRTQNDRSGTSDIQRQGDTPGAAYPRVNNPKGVKDIIPPLRGLEEGETCLVERKMSEDKNFSFIAGNKIESLDDIAYIFKQLENKAIENAFVVFHGGPGTKVQDAYVLHIGMGGIANSSVDLSPIIPMLNAVHPKQVTLVHNHPSGNIVSSRQDRALLQSVTDLVKTYARYADVTPGIIIDTTRGVYGTFDVNSQDAVGNMPDKAKDEVKVPVYKFDEAAFSPEYKPQHMKSIRTSLDVARFVASHRLGERRKVNVLCLDNAAHVIGNFFSDLTDVSTEDEARRLARECAHYAGACGARLVCVFGTGIPMNSASVAATKRLLKTADIEMVDALSIIDENYSYFSYADRGLLNEPENGYAAKAEGTAEKQTRYDMPESSGDEEVRFRRVTDPLTIARLETGKKARGYRTVKVNEDGSFGSPMAGKLGKAGEQSKATSSFYLGQWEEAEENPGLANKNGKINLIKPQGRGSVNGVDYNPYIHIRPTTLNKQFTQAWNRPELAYIETEYPESELTSGYKAEKAAKSVGRHRWNGGELILSRWDKPLRIVPWEEVADGWEDEFGETGVTFDIVPPALLQILDERGVEILAPKKSAGQAAMDAYNNWRNGVESETTMFRMSDTSDRREDESPMQFTWRIKDAYEDDFNTIDDTHILSGQEMLSKEGFRRMMNILLNVDIDALYEDYKEDFADKDKDGGRYEYEGIEPKIIIFARDETTSGEQVMTEMLHENVHGTIGEVPANAVPSMIRFFAGRYGEDARRWAEDLYQLLKKIDAEEADNEFITYNLSHDLFHRREYERVKGYAGGDEQLESFFNGIVNRIKKTENADERRKGDDGQAGRDGESLAGRTQAEAAGTGVGYTNSIQGKRDAVTDSAAKPGMEYGGSEVGDNGNLGGPDDEVRWRTVEPTDYEDSAADMTERCKAVGANLGVAVEVINEPKNSFKSSYQDGKLTINIGALNGDSPLEAALMAMCREMPLSDILGADAVREFAQELYRELPEFRQKVVEIAQQSYGWDTARAMMEYLGSMAESTTDDAESQDTWDIIETAFNKMIDKVLNRAPMGWRWVEGNTLRYILFQNAHQGDKSIATIARGAALAHNLGLSAADDENRTDGAQAARVQQAEERTGESAANLYNRVVSRMWARMDETYRDQFQSVNTLVDALEKASKKQAQGFEDIRKSLNQQSSKGLAAMQKWEREHWDKMMKAVQAIIDERGMSYDEIERYLMLKHGVERNDILAKRDARAFYQAIHDNKVAAIKEFAKQHPDLTDEEINKRISREDDILDRHFVAIESGTDSKYKELREKDYGGLTGLYSKYENIEPYDPTKETQEAYEKRLLAARKPMFDNMSDMELAADAEIADFEKRMGSDYMTELWKQINGATKAVLKHQYDANMMSRGQYEHVRDMFKYYVPLRGFAETTPEDMYSYYTSNADATFVAPLKQAKGRKTKAESPLAYIGAMASSAIAADIKNESKLALYYFVSNRQKDNDLVLVSDVWYVKQVDENGNAKLDDQGRTIFEPQYPPFTEALSTDQAKAEYEQWENEMKQLAREHRAFRGVREIDKQRLNYVVNTSKQQVKSHIITFKLGGRDMFMFINGNPRAAQAINGELNVDASKSEFTKVTLKILRGFASINTSLNPEFWLSNLQRDMLFALMSVNIKEDKAYNEAFRKNLKQALKVVRMKRDLQNGKLGTGELEQHYRLFVENGGVTGYTSVRGTDVWEAEIKKYTGETRTAIERAGAALDAVQEFGESFEQMTRFAAYLTSRQQGKSVVESVADAKELTVNFNRKGSGKGITWKESEFLRTREGRKLNDIERLFAVLASMLSVYGRHAIMFFNASVQGLNAMYLLTKKNKSKLGLWVGGYLMLGAMNAVLHSMLDGDDDDDDQYLDVPDYERRNNLLLGLKGVYLKWALPQEARVFYGMGDMVVNHSLGREPHRNIVGEVASMIGEIAPLDATSGLAAVLPSIGTPFVEVWQNKDYKGARVYNENRFLSDEEKKHIPAYRNPLKNTSKVYVALSEALNWISGGNEYEAGAVNWNPNIMEHIVEGYTGGVGTTVGKGLKFMENALGGEVKISDTPFLRRLMTWNDDRYRNAHVTDLYYYYREVAQDTERRLKEAMKAGDEKYYKKVTDSYDYKVLEVWKRYEKEMDGYDKYLRQLDGKDRKQRKQVTREHDALRARMIREISDLK